MSGSESWLDGVSRRSNQLSTQAPFFLIVVGVDCHTAGRIIAKNCHADT